MAQGARFKVNVSRFKVHGSGFRVNEPCAMSHVP